MRPPHFPPPAGGPDVEATFEALGRLGATVEDTRLLADNVNGRTSVLEGVQAFGQSVMSNNKWIQNGNYLPFRIFVGELKGVTPYYRGTDGCGFTMLSPGLWRVDAYVLIGTHEVIFTGGDWCDLDIILFDAAGNERQRKRFLEILPEGTERTIGGSHPFVVPEPGWSVIAYGNTGRWRKYRGGALFSSFAVTKYGHEVSALPPQTVPDSERTD